MSTPQRASPVTNFQTLAGALLTELEQLARYRLSSTQSGSLVLEEPYLVEVNATTFALMGQLMASLARELGVQGLDGAEQEHDIEADLKETAYVESCMLSALLVMKLNIRRKQAFMMYASRYSDGGSGGGGRKKAEPSRSAVVSVSPELASLQSVLNVIYEAKVLDSLSPVSAELGAVRLELAQVGGPAMVVQLMRLSPNQHAVQASGCRALCEQVEIARDGGEMCAESGGMQAVLDAFRNCDLNLEVLLPGFRLLSLVHLGSAYDKLGDLHQFCNVVLACMNRHISNVELQLSSMRIISNIAKLGNAEKSLLQREAAGEGDGGGGGGGGSGGGGASKQQQQQQQQAQGMRGFFSRNLARTQAGRLARTHKRHSSNPMGGERFLAVFKTLAPNTIPVMTHVLREHPHEKEIQREGCMLLSLLSSIGNSALALLAKTDGIATMSTIVAASENDATLQQLAMRLLCNLLSFSKENGTTVQPRVLLRALRMFPNDTDIAASALLLLVDHIRAEPLRRQLIQENGISVVVMTVTATLRFVSWRRRKRALIAACGADILNVYLAHADDQQIDAFPIADIDSCLIGAFDRYQTKENTIGKSLVGAFTKLLSVQSTAVRQKQLADLVTAKRVIEVMKLYPDDAHVQCDGIWCLEYISDLMRKEVADAGGFKVIVSAMRK